MEIKQVAKMLRGQDGVIWGNELFRFEPNGECVVYNLLDIDKDKLTELVPFCSFYLDKSDLIAPHSNAVFWGSDYFDPDDEFPLLYSNIYNNYAKREDKLMGVCCVYRLQRDGNSFKTTFVQLIQIGFTEDTSLWKAYPDHHGVRPYGNFVIDRDDKYFYAFVMRNETLGTRYFKFKIPALSDGEFDAVYGVNKVILQPDDICDMFDCPYHRFIQGATSRDGKIYSTEGFASEEDRPVIRVIDLKKKCQEIYLDLWENGYKVEAEMIDFYGDVCYYSDADGHLYSLEF